MRGPGPLVLCPEKGPELGVGVSAIKLISSADPGLVSFRHEWRVVETPTPVFFELIRYRATTAQEHINEFELSGGFEPGDGMDARRPECPNYQRHLPALRDLCPAPRIGLLASANPLQWAAVLPPRLPRPARLCLGESHNE
jgi:hypothetical protein